MKFEFKPFKRSLSGGEKWENKTKDQRDYSRKEARRKATQSMNFPTDNREFAKTNQSFRSACEEAGVNPSRRQASKFRSKRGSAYVTSTKNI